MEIKDLIKTKRIEKKLSMKELADIVGVSESTISRYESGEIASMKRSVIVAMSKALDIPPMKFLGIDEEATAKISAPPTGIEGSRAIRLPVLGAIAGAEGANELLTNCQQLKMKAPDGKLRKTGP